MIHKILTAVILISLLGTMFVNIDQTLKIRELQARQQLIFNVVDKLIPI